MVVQETDARLLDIKRNYRRLDNAIKGESGLGQLRKDLEALKARELEQKLKIARLESERTELQQRSEELEKRLYGGLITQVREMRAVEVEQAEMKRRIEQINEGRNPLEMELEAMNKEREDLQQQLAQREEQWKSEREALLAERAKCAKEYKDLEQRRGASFKDIPKQHLELYREIFLKTRGTAVVRVERGVCMGCNLSLPLQPRRGADFGKNLPRCSNCSRIIIFD